MVRSADRTVKILNGFNATYHIRVIEVSGSGDLAEVSSVVTVEIQNTSDAVPRVLDISIVTPDVACRGNLLIVRLFKVIDIELLIDVENYIT